MSKWAERALRALVVYYERGVRAQVALQEGRYEDAETVLNMRKAAFHNFRAAEYIAAKEGYTAELQAEMFNVWKQIEPLNAEITQLLEVARDLTEVQLAQLARVRAALSRFKSSESETQSFEKSV